jgi:ubiquinone/menaquinone biosynthesis C-methylase UbiE
MQKDAYRLLGKVYDRLIDPFLSGQRDSALLLYPPFPGMSVLDVGCGTGSTLKIYLQAGCSVTGIDLSPTMLASARQKLGAQAVLHLGDASRMPFPDCSFDLVTAVLSLHEIPPLVRTAVFSEMVRVVRLSGSLLVTEYHSGPFPTPRAWWYQKIRTVIEFLAGREHFANYRQFIAQDGLTPLIAAYPLELLNMWVASGTATAIYLLRPVDSYQR